MIERDPTSWSAATWLLAVGMAIIGGLVNWWTRVRNGSARALNIIELIGEIVTSGFVGVLVFMLLDALDQPLGVCAAASGVGGHMATRLLFLAERHIEAWLSTMVTSHDHTKSTQRNHAAGHSQQSASASSTPQRGDGHMGH